jgi:hypothetical protein
MEMNKIKDDSTCKRVHFMFVVGFRHLQKTLMKVLLSQKKSILNFFEFLNSVPAELFAFCNSLLFGNITFPLLLNLADSC